jgi:hypothetical protein
MAFGDQTTKAANYYQTPVLRWLSKWAIIIWRWNRHEVGCWSAFKMYKKLLQFNYWAVICKWNEYQFCNCVMYISFVNHPTKISIFLFYLYLRITYFDWYLFIKRCYLAKAAFRKITTSEDGNSRKSVLEFKMYV